MFVEPLLRELDLQPGDKTMVEKALERCSGSWSRIDELVFSNQMRVVTALQSVRLGEDDFQDSSGYGYHDRGREKLEDAFACAFKGEDALVRPQIVSGTHALTITLFALLRPGDLLLSITGKPYETLETVIGSRGSEEGTLKEWGIQYHYLPTDSYGYPLLDNLNKNLNPRVAYIQRSAGYSLERRSLTVQEIGEMADLIHSIYPGALVVVDNCYGEFVSGTEPTAMGADLVAGSLIKNPGGGLAPGGGYAVGRKDLIRKLAARLTAPGLYGKLGAMTGKRSLFQGLFMAPVLTGNALKNALFAAALFELAGYRVQPGVDDKRGDIVQGIILGDRDKVKLFCSAIQGASPVDSHLTPVPGELPGYDGEVIMAAGTFFQGASGELSADAPVRSPYAVFMQGALTLPHALWATCRAFKAIREI